MNLTNKCLVAVVAGALTGVPAALAQAAPAAVHKSSSVTTLGEGDALMIGHKGQKIFKSNTKVSAAAEKNAMANGAKQIADGTVIYKEGGKLYMLPGNDQAAQTFQSDFNTAY